MMICHKAIKHAYTVVAYAFILATAAFLASCGGKSRPAYNLDELRIGENVSLRYWMPRIDGSGSPDEIGEMPLYRELERVTGVDIVFEHPLYSQARLQLEVLQQSDDLADIIEWNWLTGYPEGPARAIGDGLIMRLNELIGQYAPNAFKSIADDDEILRAVTTESGDVYAFPYLRSDLESRAQGGLMVRREWLDKVDWVNPKTIDDWRNMLRAMREMDFGTVGTGREYPFFFPVFRLSPLDDVPNYLFFAETNPFAGAWGTAHGMYRDDSGRVQYGPVQDGYRDMLVELNQWFEEDLIHPNIVNPGTFRSFFDTVAKCGATIGVSSFMDDLEPFDYVPLPPPVLETDIMPVGAELLSVYNGSRSAAVSARSSKAVDAVRFLDVAYGDWGHVLFNYGIENESYRLNRGEPVFMDDFLTRYETAIKRGAERSSELMTYARLLWGGPFSVSGDALRQIRDPEGYAAGLENPWLVGARTPPDAVFLYDRDRQAEYQRIMTPIEQHAMQSFAAFLTGSRPLSEFETYVSEIESLDLSGALSLLYNAEAEFYTKPTW